MGNEAGEWIIHGVTWDDPKCIHDVDEAVEYINRVGFFLFLRTKFRGFLWRNGQWQNIGGLMIR